MLHKLRKDILEAIPPLVVSMIYKFSIHAAKGPWTNVPMHVALAHLDEEVGELKAAIWREASVEEILDEAADIANMAVIISHNYANQRGEATCSKENSAI